MVLSNNRANFRSMKKYLLLFISIVVLAGCKLDEAGFPTPEAAGTITGTWFIKKQTTSGIALGIPIPTNTDTNFTSLDFYRFNADLSVVFSESNPVMVTNGTYVYKKTLSPSTLVLTKNGTDNNFTVKKLTSDSLVLASNISMPSIGTETNVIIRLARK